ncbi:DEAD/DEAH box helicase, partial [candidate division KSB1 bacterium]|nr:DEAD/DEAH box helicase [candidate division KSB1 bacterium]
MKEFQELKLQKPIIRALQFNSYEKPTPIQAQSIPVALERKDIIACAQTGTGKTAAFALPILQMLMKNNKAPESKSARVLILAPTRELAGQIDESFRVYGRYLKISRALIYGGVKATGQIRDLRRGVDILIATPGRLLDLFNQGKLRLDKIEVIVLDEADRMLDMGFLPDVRKIYSAIPEDRQSMLFSATFPDEIRKLTRKFLNNPVYVAVSPPAKTV